MKDSIDIMYYLKSSFMKCKLLFAESVLQVSFIHQQIVVLSQFFSVNQLICLQNMGLDSQNIM